MKHVCTLMLAALFGAATVGSAAAQLTPAQKAEVNSIGNKMETCRPEILKHQATLERIVASLKRTKNDAKKAINAAKPGKISEAASRSFLTKLKAYTRDVELKQKYLREKRARLYTLVRDMRKILPKFGPGGGLVTGPNKGADRWFLKIKGLSDDVQMLSYGSDRALKLANEELDEPWSVQRRGESGDQRLTQSTRFRMHVDSRVRAENCWEI